MTSQDLYDTIQIKEWTNQRDPVPKNFKSSENSFLARKRRKLTSKQGQEDEFSVQRSGQITLKLNFLKKILNSAELQFSQFLSYLQDILPFFKNNLNELIDLLPQHTFWKIYPSITNEVFCIARARSLDFFTINKLDQNKIDHTGNVKLPIDCNNAFQYNLGAWDDSSSIFLIADSECNLRVYSSNGNIFSFLKNVFVEQNSPLGSRNSSKDNDDMSLDETSNLDNLLSKPDWQLEHTPVLLSYLTTKPTKNEIAKFIVLSRQGHFSNYILNSLGEISKSSRTNFEDFTRFSPIIDSIIIDDDQEKTILLISHKCNTWKEGQTVPDRISDIGVMELRMLKDGITFSESRFNNPLSESECDSDYEEEKPRKRKLKTIPNLAKNLILNPFTQEKLAVLHANSSISIWDVPPKTNSSDAIEYEILQFYESSDLPFYNVYNPAKIFENNLGFSSSAESEENECEDHDESIDDPFEGTKNNSTSQKSLKIAKQCEITQVSWWSSDILIFTRKSGCVFLMKYNEETSNLDLIFDQEGKKCLWLLQNPIITSLFEHCSLLLDYKKITTGLIDEFTDELQLVEMESNPLIKLIKEWVNYFKGFILYQDKDNFNFDGRPGHKRRPKFGGKSEISSFYHTFDYKLLKIKNTTPTELFNKKLSNQEWGEALEIAARFDGLDKDQVYQKRWESCSKNDVSQILDYLNKIENLSYIFKECNKTVPESFKIQEVLLEFVLKKCDIFKLVEIVNNHKSLDFYGDSEDGDNRDDNFTEEKEPAKYTGFDPILKQINELEINNHTIQRQVNKWCELRNPNKSNSILFNADELELLNHRNKFLHHQKQLNLYYKLINFDERNYCSNYYQSIKNISPLDLAIRIARNSKIERTTKFIKDLKVCEKLEIVLKFYRRELGEFYLDILGEIDEMVDPEGYGNILPCDENDDQMNHMNGIFKIEQNLLKIENLSKDWIYNHPFSLTSFKPINQTPTSSTCSTNLKTWYETRATNISNFSGRSDYSYKLLKIALSEKNVNVSNGLLKKFECLNSFVYKGFNDYINLVDLGKMSGREILRVWVGVTNETFSHLFSI